MWMSGHTFNTHQAVDSSVVAFILTWYSGKDSACQCTRHKRCEFNPWVRKIPWSKKWQPTPVFFPRKFHGQRSLVGYNSWRRKESDTTHTAHSFHILLAQTSNSDRDERWALRDESSGQCQVFYENPLTSGNARDLLDPQEWVRTFQSLLWTFNSPTFYFNHYLLFVTTLICHLRQLKC